MCIIKEIEVRKALKITKSKSGCPNGIPSEIWRHLVSNGFEMGDLPL